MPAEIADSDGESDCASPRRPSISPLADDELDTRHLDPAEPDPVLDLPFSQFLSPTQRLSSMADHQQNDTHLRSTGSTDTFLREMDQEQQRLHDSTSIGLDGSQDRASGLIPRIKTKRRFSEIEEASPSMLDNPQDMRKATKRAKTYGSSKSLRSDSVDILALDEERSAMHLNGVTSHVDQDAAQGQHILSNGVQRVDNHDIQEEREEMFYVPQQPVRSSLQSKLGRMPATSGYQGITLDFRHGTHGLDVNANPFGSLSQISLDGDVDPADVKQFTDIFTGRHRSGDPDIQVMRTATDHVPPSSKSDHDSKSGSQAREHGTGVKDASSHKASNGFSDGRTKNCGSVVDDHMSDQISMSAESAMSKKQKSDDSLLPHATISSPAKNLSSELGLNDPNMIGLPPEVYHAKPSRSRSKRQDTEQFAQHPDHESRVDATTSGEAVTESRAPPEPVKAAKKPGRKSKVKRAKTSAAALLKKSQTWHDDGDDEVLWLEEKPAPVKMDLPPEVTHLKKEDLEQQKDDTDPILAAETIQAQEFAQAQKEVKEGSKQFRIDVPPLPGVATSIEESAVAQPKKRGRKPKKKPDDDTAHDATEDTPITTTKELDRMPLAEKDVNVAQSSQLLPDMAKTVRPDDGAQIANDAVSVDTSPLKHDLPPLSKSPRKPVHSPLKPKTLQPTAGIPAPSTLSATPSPSKPSITTTPTTATATTALSSLFAHKPRVGLSRSTRIPSLLRKLDRTKEPPKVQERKEKLTKKQLEAEEKRKLEAEDCNGDGDGDNERTHGGGSSSWTGRGVDGMLIEWND